MPVSSVKVARLRPFASRAALPASISSYATSKWRPVNRAAMPARTHIIAQPLGLCVRIGERDVAVRPDEIEGRAQEAGAAHCLPPRELVEWKLKFGTDLGQAAARFS